MTIAWSSLEISLLSLAIALKVVKIKSTMLETYWLIGMLICW